MNTNLKSSGQAKGSRGKKGRLDLIWNILTGVMLLTSVCMAGYFVSILQNPASQLNPLPPPSATPTPIPATATPLALEPTWTLTVTLAPTFTSTKRPTITLPPSATQYLFPTATSALTATKTGKPSPSPYTATISYQDSSAYGKSCDTLLVGGWVKDAGNNPVIGMIVKLGGAIGGKTLNPPIVKLTGIAPAYGPSGFEFDLGMAPVASSNTLWVQLYDQGGTPVSSQVPLTTEKDCKKDLVFVGFQQK
jgi:hypothetical protein